MQQLQFEENYQNINISPTSKAICFILSNPSIEFPRVWIEELKFLIRIKCQNEDKIMGVLLKLGLDKVEHQIEEYAQKQQISQNSVFF